MINHPSSPAADAAGDGLLTGATGRHHLTTALRAAILHGDLVPGQRLVEAELVDQHHVTRTSTRAAMDDLAAEGLLERIPNRGVRVRTVTLDEAIGILECREVLEGLLAARAATQISDRDRIDLHDLGRAMTAAVAAGAIDDYSRLNARLHADIAHIAGQKTAADLIGRLRSQLVRHQYRLSQRPGRLAASLAQHIAIIDAVTARDPERAERAARDHIVSVIDSLREPTS